MQSMQRETKGRFTESSTSMSITERYYATGTSFGHSFHAGMAWLLIVVAVAGFAPRSLAIVSGTMPNPPLVVHLHAAVMALWVALLAVQATLSLAGRMDLHRKWGLASLAAAPLVLIMLVAITIVRQNDAAGTPGAPIVNNILFVQIRSIVLFPTFFVWALLTRHTDPQTHKRMMLLATLSLLDAGIARMNWLPHNQFPNDYLAIHLYLLLLLVPALMHDLIRLRRIHRAWVWGLVLMLPKPRGPQALHQLRSIGAFRADLEFHSELELHDYALLDPSRGQRITRSTQSRTVSCIPEALEHFPVNCTSRWARDSRAACRVRSATCAPRRYFP